MSIERQIGIIIYIFIYIYIYLYIFIFVYIIISFLILDKLSAWPTVPMEAFAAILQWHCMYHNRFFKCFKNVSIFSDIFSLTNSDRQAR